MKLIYTRQTFCGLARLDVVVIVFILAGLAILLLPALAAAKRKAAKISCANNLAQMGLAFRIWQGEHADNYFTGVSVTNNPATLRPAQGNATEVFQMLSNELSTPFILVCPADKRCKPAPNFNAPLTSSNISYFINTIASGINPQELLSGDDNFEIAGIPIESGLWEISSNTPIAWSANRHRFFGNLAMADGSVSGAISSTLKDWFQSTNSGPLRLSIP